MVETDLELRYRSDKRLTPTAEDILLIILVFVGKGDVVCSLYLFFANSFLLTCLPHRVGVESDEAGFLDFLIILARVLFP